MISNHVLTFCLLIVFTLTPSCTVFEVTRPHKDSYPDLQLLGNLPRNITDPDILYEVIDFYELQIRLYQQHIDTYARQ